MKDAAIWVKDQNNRTIAVRLTNRNGLLDMPISVDVPNLEASQRPAAGTRAYSLVNIAAALENYESVSIENVQVFANTITEQNIELIPLSEFPDKWNQRMSVVIPPQNL